MPTTIVALFIGIIIGYFVGRGFSSPQISKIVQERSTQKEARKQQIIAYLKEHGKAGNNDIEKLLGVSDASVTNYLQELENEGRVEQIGATGKYVTYQLK